MYLCSFNRYIFKYHCPPLSLCQKMNWCFEYSTLNYLQTSLPALTSLSARVAGAGPCFFLLVDYCLPRAKASWVELTRNSWSRIHEHTILLKFLSIILREFSDLRFLYGFLKPFEGGWFSVRFSSFLFYSVQYWTVETVRGWASLKKYISQSKAVELTVNKRKESFCLDFVQKSGKAVCGPHI